VLFDQIESRLGKTSNLFRTLAVAPAVLDAYVAFTTALEGGRLEPAFREQVAIAVAQANSCEYCLSAHTAIGTMVGLTPDEIAASRHAHGQDALRDAGLQFAQALVVQRGEVSNMALARVKTAGYTDGEIAEIIANVAVNIFTNYFNHVARTEIDFRRVPVALPRFRPS